MKAKEFLSLNEEIENKVNLWEWVCPKCGKKDLPNESRECECGYKMPEELNDKIRGYYEKLYKQVFGRIKGKIFETDLPTANSVRFCNTLCKYGILRRLRNGRFVEMLKIPQEFIVQCFVEGDMNKLRKMAYRRKNKKEMMSTIRPYQKV